MLLTRQPEHVRSGLLPTVHVHEADRNFTITTSYIHLDEFWDWSCWMINIIMIFTAKCLLQSPHMYNIYSTPSHSSLRWPCLLWNRYVGHVVAGCRAWGWLVMMGTFMILYPACWQYTSHYVCTHQVSEYAPLNIHSHPKDSLVPMIIHLCITVAWCSHMHEVILLSVCITTTCYFWSFLCVHRYA